MLLTAEATNATAPAEVYMSTPLVYYPHDLAYKISVAAYLHVGCLAANNLKGDYMLVTRYRVRLPTVLYFTTRITLLAYMLCRAVLLTLPVAHCARMYDALNALLIIFASATTALFYLRVCAVWSMSRYIIVTFGILWLWVVGMLQTIVLTFTAVHIADTQYCAERVHGHLLGPATITLMVYNTLAYLAVAYRIFTMFAGAAADQAPNGTKMSIVLTFGNALPIVSRALLRGSQLYFMAVVITNPLTIACIYAFEPPVSVMFLVCHLVLVNIFSCRVYRNLRMGLDQDEAMPSRPSNGGALHPAVGTLVFREVHTNVTEGAEGEQRGSRMGFISEGSRVEESTWKVYKTGLS